MMEEWRKIVILAYGSDSPIPEDKQNFLLARAMRAAKGGDNFHGRMLHQFLYWMLINRRGWHLTAFGKRVLIEMHGQLVGCRGVKAKRAEIMMDVLYLRSGPGNPHSEEDEIRNHMICVAMHKEMEDHEAQGDPIGPVKASKLVSNWGLFDSFDTNRNSVVSLTPKTVLNIFYEKFPHRDEETASSNNS